MVNREKLAKIIIELRKKKGYSQRKLAMISGVSNSTISRIESATSDADPETLKKLAPYLEIPYETLMQAAGYIDIGVNENSVNENKEISEVDKFLLKLKEEMQKQGLDFDETSPEELIETYKLLMEFKKKTQNNKDK